MRSGGEPSEVLISSLIGAPARRRRRRARARPIEAGGNSEALPLTRVTVVTPERLDTAGAARWLERVAGDPEAANAFVDRAVRLVNRALHAHAASAWDPYVAELSASRAVATRIGYGEGEQVADGRWTEARELERGEPRRRRAEALGPQEQISAVLGGRGAVSAAESLLLRARLDLDQGRTREAALQLQVGLAALLAEAAGRGTERDIAQVRAREAEAVRLAEVALGGELGAGAGAWLAETLALCERAIRRLRRPRDSD